MVNEVRKTVRGKEISIESGKMAKQADGAVTVRMGDSVVLVTCVCAKKLREGIGFFPLMCDYQEKTYAAGKVPGGYFKREGRPTEKEILTSRLIDRPIRPLFPKGMMNDVQIVATAISGDGENETDVLAMIGASACLSISDIPFNGPIGTCRVGRVDGQFVVNPTIEELTRSDLNLLLTANENDVVMIESESAELSEETVLEAIEEGHQAIREIIELQKELVEKCGKPKRSIELIVTPPDILDKVRALAKERFAAINQMKVKEERQEAVDQLGEEIVAKLVTEDGDIATADVKNAFYEVEEESVRQCIVGEKRRVDGRGFKDIRSIDCEIGLLPRTHGSALFTRGQTQSLSTVTLGNQRDEQFIDGLYGESRKGFTLHYNFPSFSVGEVRPMRGPGRREIGHGALAERALKAVLPEKEIFPYTIRLVSEILESNGSSSMATVCAGTLSLMDAGVPIKSPVSGIAMGLITNEDDAVILTDIAGAEDHFGDMDFKVAGTKDGITAIQLDIKIPGIKKELMKAGFAQAREARLSILQTMIGTIQTPKENISPYAPKMVMIKIPVDKIGEIIGPGGKNIKKLIEQTGADINIDDEGRVQISGTAEADIDGAVARIKGVTEEPVVGKRYFSTVKKIMPFGAFCEYLPGRDGLVHVSELSNTYVKNPEDVVKVGDQFYVKLIAIDDMGRVKLSAKQALEDQPVENEKQAGN